MHLNDVNPKASRNIKAESLPFEEAELIGGRSELFDFAQGVIDRYNEVLVKWTGRTAVAQAVNVVTNPREVTVLDRPDSQGRSIFEVWAERYNATFGYHFQMSGGIRQPYRVLRVDAVLPWNEPVLLKLDQRARDNRLAKIRQERYKDLHRVDQMTAILKETLDFA